MAERAKTLNELKRDRGVGGVRRGYRSSKAQKNYGYRWRKARKSWLVRNPLCVKCKEEGKVVQAEVVDHIIPHKGNIRLFWDKSNWQSLCTPCHNEKTAKEDGGFGNRMVG